MSGPEWREWLRGLGVGRVGRAWAPGSERSRWRTVRIRDTDEGVDCWDGRELRSFVERDEVPKIVDAALDREAVAL